MINDLLTLLKTEQPAYRDDQYTMEILVGMSPEGMANVAPTLSLSKLKQVKAITRVDWAEKHSSIDAELARREEHFNQKVYKIAKVSAIAAIASVIVSFIGWFF